MHPDQLTIDAAGVRALLRDQFPELAGATLQEAGHGTDNLSYRVSKKYVVRLPLTPHNSLAKELRWLPTLAQQLDLPIPHIVHIGSPAPSYPQTWALYSWVKGHIVTPQAEVNWDLLGRELAGFVRQLHGVQAPNAAHDPELRGYRAGSLSAQRDGFGAAVERCRAMTAPAIQQIDWDLVSELLVTGLDLPDPIASPVLLHADLKPTNVVVRRKGSGELAGVLDWGSLCWGWPDAEHATIWDYPAATRASYRQTLALDDQTWLRARSWALGIAATGLHYYWESFPEFARECLARLTAVTDHAIDRATTAQAVSD